jgi:hypothetical protein
LKTNQLKSLRNAFELVKDPRRKQSRRHPLTAMLTLIALGLLMGGRDMFNIWRKFACLDQRQHEAIGLRVRHKEGGLLEMPGCDTLNDRFHLLDRETYAHALSAWLQANSGRLPHSLAPDGKSIGDGKCGMII